MRACKVEEIQAELPSWPGGRFEMNLVPTRAAMDACRFRVEIPFAEANPYLPTTR
jgi:hypothetical protein